MYFNYLGIKDGLPEGTATVLLQDREKYMWIGTQNGLVRCDGYATRKYDFETKDINSSNITALFEGGRSNLWIGTINGLYRYNRSNDNVEKIKSNSYLDTCACMMHYIKEDHRNKLWIKAQDMKSQMAMVGLIDPVINQRLPLPPLKYRVPYRSPTMVAAFQPV